MRVNVKEENCRGRICVAWQEIAKQSSYCAMPIYIPGRSRCSPGSTSKAAFVALSVWNLNECKMYVNTIFRISPTLCPHTCQYVMMKHVKIKIWEPSAFIRFHSYCSYIYTHIYMYIQYSYFFSQPSTYGLKQSCSFRDVQEIQLFQRQCFTMSQI